MGADGEPAWCELEFEAETKTVLVTVQTFSIGRVKANDLQLNDPRVSSRHCQLLLNEKAGAEGSLVLMDGSTNGTYVNGKKVGKGNSQTLSDGDKVEIVVGAPSLTFSFKDVRPPKAADDQKDDDDHEEEEEDEEDKTLQVDCPDEDEVEPDPAKPADDSIVSAPATADKEDKDGDDIEAEIKCAICLGICHKIVTLIPCMHNFCSSCYSQTMDTPMGKKCPQCRADTTEVRRNHALHNIIEKYLKENPSRKRTAEELADMDAKDKITDESLRIQGRKRRRRHSDDDEDDSDMGSDYSGSGSEDEDDDEEAVERCHNCAHAAPDGFTCPADAAPHDRCQICFRLFPQRTATADGSPMPPRTCGGCGKVCCGPYFHWLNSAAGAAPVAPAGIPPLLGAHMCWQLGSGKFEEVSVGPMLPPTVHANNRFERSLTERAMTNAGFTPTTLFQHCVREVQAGRLSVHSSVPRADHLNGLLGVAGSAGQEWGCRKCVWDLFAGLAFSWRLANPDASLPSRPDCWYGYNCRTQTHNQGHRERWNHICAQTRF